MSGFALIFDTRGAITPQDQSFVNFKESVAHYKQLNLSTCHEITGEQCAAVKFDTPSTLHRGITVDEQSGSWLMAVGTVLDDEKDLDSNLQTLLSDYLRRGNAAFQSLDGPFALVIYNKPANKLAIVPAPLGFVSVFYARRGNRVYIATSALAVAQAVQATPSELGTYLFLTLGNFVNKLTLWQEVDRLLGGTVLDITPAGGIESVYWTPSIQDEIVRLPLNEAVDYAFDLLSRVFRKHLGREGKIWADLTGGFDSRLVTMLMDYCGLPFKARCEGPCETADVLISSQIAQRMGWEYQHAILPEDWGQERYKWLPRALGKADGHVDVFKASQMLWDQEQRALEYTTSIWGLGGELWRGTGWKQEFWNIGKTTTVNYDRLVDYRYLNPLEPIFAGANRTRWIREELKSLFKFIGEQNVDWPNTAKLDHIFALYDATSDTGNHTSAVMGIQRVMSPLYFKKSMICAISIYYKWRNHSRLVRLMLEKTNPVLAGVETNVGGPALPMRATNFYEFIPYWAWIGKQFVRKTSQTVLGRDILPKTRHKTVSYPLVYPTALWRQQTLDCLEQDKILDPAHMHSARLYNAERLADFLKQARTEEFNQGTFLSRILTVEMALRAVGAFF